MAASPGRPANRPLEVKIILAHILQQMRLLSLALMGLLDLSSGEIASILDIKNTQRGNNEETCTTKNGYQCFSVLDND